MASGGGAARLRSERRTEPSGPRSWPDPDAVDTAATASITAADTAAAAAVVAESAADADDGRRR